MVAAVAAAFEPDALTGGVGEFTDHLRGNGFGSRVIEHGLRPFGVGASLISDRLETVDAVFQRRVVDIGHARLNGVVESFEAQIRFGDALLQLGDMFTATLALLLPAVENVGEDGFQPLRLQQLVFKMTGDQIVQLLHRHRHTLAGGRPLPRFDRAGIVAVSPALSGADGHGPATLGAMDKAGEHGRPTDDAGWHNLGITRLEQRLNGVEHFLVDNRRDRDGHDFAGGFQLLGLTALVELMLAHVGAARQDAVDLTDAPATAVTGEDAAAVEVGDDVLDAHLAGGAVAFQREAIDQPHGVGVKRIDLKFLLGLRAALLGSDDAITDRRERAIPEALPGILLQGADDVLGVLFRLIFVEQRHDLPHHNVHGIVAHLLRDRHQLDAVLRQLSDVELQLEMVTEKAAERVDHDDIEQRGLARPGFYHALELGAAVVGGRSARLYEGVDKLIASRRAIAFALPLLVGDGDIMLGLPHRRNAQVKGRAQRHGGERHILYPFLDRRDRHCRYSAASLIVPTIHSFRLLPAAAAAMTAAA